MTTWTNVAPLALSSDPRWDTPRLAYNVQVPLADEAASTLEALQHQLGSRLTVPLRLIPRHALHVSAYAMLPVRSNLRDKDEVWRTLSSDVTRVLEGSLARYAAELRLRPTASR